MNISLVPASVFPTSTKLPHLVPILATDQVVPGMEVILTGFQPYTNAKFSCCGSRSHGFMVFIIWKMYLSFLAFVNNDDDCDLQASVGLARYFVVPGPANL